MSENMKIWDAVKQPPPHALRPITFGNLKGKSDISPQWRYQALTEQFGPCGVGWKFDIVKTWTEAGSDDKVFAFSQVNLFIKVDGEWSEPIPGIGGDFLINLRNGKTYCNDEAFKMATTDALGVACKMVGVAADIYAGLWDGSKYVSTEPATKPTGENKLTIGERTEIANNLSDYGLVGEEIRLLVEFVADQKQCGVHDKKIGIALLKKEDCAAWIKEYNAAKKLEDAA